MASGEIILAAPTGSLSYVAEQELFIDSSKLSKKHLIVIKNENAKK